MLGRRRQACRRDVIKTHPGRMTFPCASALSASHNISLQGQPRICCNHPRHRFDSGQMFRGCLHITHVDPQRSSQHLAHRSSAQRCGGIASVVSKTQILPSSSTLKAIDMQTPSQRSVRNREHGQQRGKHQGNDAWRTGAGITGPSSRIQVRGEIFFDPNLCIRKRSGTLRVSARTGAPGSLH